MVAGSFENELKEDRSVILYHNAYHHSDRQDAEGGGNYGLQDLLVFSTMNL